ncbi:TIGR03545 family protein [Sulfurimonas lithotrophica]|uniref:TIGR03545 family protein n=1 Tax=Sulfurimonas lithotrophica TaxID=2590022 RepID=A0A5P8P0H3_9BACT|nr:TIGR03545 family protein [Sulfurimonas lithotrophica]QFR49100.1 TIGR03545 family protein [Sulfurimonas lithotrophica]
MLDFFIKLFKTFNSSQTPWQMSLSISLGMAMGLTPFIGWQSIVIVLFVLVINIHIGLFIVSSAFFAGIAYLLDPTFESLGYNILTNPNLQDLFTTAYNSSLMRMTYFNNTLVTGSSVVAFALLIPMYFVLNSLVYIYRDKIAGVLQKYTIFKFLGIEVSGKKDRFLRIWGFGVFAILGTLIGVFILVFLDPLAKIALEKSISKATDKNVQIDNVNLSLKEGALKIDNLNIFENGVSSFRSKNIGVDIDFNQLLFNRYHVNNLSVKGMEFKQSTDAKVQQKEIKKQKESSSPSLDFGSIDLPKPETLIANMGLSSTTNYENAEKEFNSIEKKYKDIVDKYFSKDELKSIKADVEKIKSNLKKIQKIKKLKPEHYDLISNALEDIEKLRKTIKQKRKVLKTLKNDFEKDKNILRKFSDELINGAKNDYENLSKNYRFDEQGGINVVGALFGNNIKGYLKTFLDYYEVAKPYLSSKEEPPAPPRGEGRWIKYKELNSLADIYVKNIDIDGIYETHKFLANIKNISSNQKLINKPVSLNIKSDGKLSKNIDFKIVKLQKADYNLNLNAKTLDYITIDADAKINYAKTQFSSKNLKNLKEFYIDIILSKEIYSPNIKVKSDLDKKLKDIFQKAIEEQVLKYKNRLKELIDSKMQEKLKKLGLKNSEIVKLGALLNGSLDDFSNTEQLLNSYEKELKSQAKNRLKEKATEKVGDLLKSFKF